MAGVGEGGRPGGDGHNRAGKKENVTRNLRVSFSFYLSFPRMCRHLVIHHLWKRSLRDAPVQIIITILHRYTHKKGDWPDRGLVDVVTCK
jgi:hypothetical protein